MKLPKSFRTEKNLDEKIEQLIESSTNKFKKGIIQDLSGIFHDLMTKDSDVGNVSDFYAIGLEIAEKLEYDMFSLVKVIEDIDQIMFAIASSVEEQTTVTNDISSNISATAENAKELNLNAKESVDAVQQVAINIESTSNESDLIQKDVKITTMGIEGVLNYVSKSNESVKASAQGIEEIQVQADELASLAKNLKQAIHIFKV